LHARRDLHRELPGPPDVPRAAARVARMLHDPAGPTAPGAGTVEREWSLVLGDAPRPRALRSDLGRRPRLGPRAPARGARRRAPDPQPNRHAFHGLVEGDANLGLEVCPLAGRASPAPASAVAE